VSAISALLRGRMAAESLMVDACTVHRPGEPETDPTTGKVTVSKTMIYGPDSTGGGKCKIQQTIAQASGKDSAEHRFTVQEARWDTPVGSGPFMVNDIVTMTSSGLDPHMPGRVYRVTELFHKTFATAQRCRLEEVTA